MKLKYTLFSLVALLLLALTAACGDDDDDGGGGSEEERQEIADLAETLATTNGADATEEEIDFYLAHITDEFLQEFGTESVDACAENPQECIGEPLGGVSVNPDDVSVDGDSATATVQSEIGPQGLEFTREDDVWKASGLYVADDEIPEDTEVIDVSMTEFEFGADFESDAIKSGDFAFHMTNDGDQPHEAILVALPAEGELADLLQDDSFQPEPIFVKVPYGPGDESDVALPAPLEAGRYGLVCFLPDTEDPDQTPHAFLGMATEFTVE